MNGILTNKIVLVAGGELSPGCGVVNTLLHAGARVIVPVPNKDRIYRLYEHLTVADTANLIVYPADFGDYEKAEELVNIIVSEFGQIDLVVSAIEKNGSNSSLIDADINDWCRTMDTNITSSFVIDRLCLPLMGSNGGVLISITNTDNLSTDVAAPMTRIAGLTALELSKVFAAEALPRGIHYYHLLVNNVATPGAEQPATDTLTVTPEMIGAEVVRLYESSKLIQEPTTFHFLTGHPIEPYILNRLQ